MYSCGQSGKQVVVPSLNLLLPRQSQLALAIVGASLCWQAAVKHKARFTHFTLIFWQDEFVCV